jgi:hypothetical protein
MRCWPWWWRAVRPWGCKLGSELLCAHLVICLGGAEQSTGTPLLEKLKRRGREVDTFFLILFFSSLSLHFLFLFAG